MRESPKGRPTPLPSGHRLHRRATAHAAAVFVAEHIARVIEHHAGLRAGGRAVLGLATGKTPIGVYDELARLHEGGLSFANVETFNLDEYWPIALDHPASFHRFMHEQLFDRVDIPRGMRHVPNGSVPEGAIERHAADYEASITRAGGVQLQLLGIGGNGHIGFNEPGSPRSGRTRRVTLAAQTRADNAGAFGDQDAVPTHAITMGIGTILDARAIVVLAIGKRKADIVRAALLGPITEDVPASLLRTHRAVHWVLDADAASALPQ